MDMTLTEQTTENELLNKRLATELGIHTNAIINTLREEENPVPYEEINDLYNSGNGNLVFVEKEGNLIRANVINPDNEKLHQIDMDTDSKSLNATITQETFDLLSTFALDPLEKMEVAKEKLGDTF
jgi:hypothetical protein